MQHEPNSPIDLLIVLIGQLKRHPLADRMVIFGSVASGHKPPGDLDILVDLRSGGGKGLDDILRLARYGGRYYGLFDPFVLVYDRRFDRDVLWTRDDEGRSWIMAKRAGQIKRSARDGVPLGDFDEENLRRWLNQNDEDT